MKSPAILTASAAVLVLGGFAIPATQADTFGNGTNTFTIDFVTIGDPGNPVDTGTTGSHFSSIGAVGYTFRMGTYEISRDMITRANALVVSGGGGLGITLSNMVVLGGNIGTHPATGVSWNKAARFVNWLNTSSGYAPAYNFAVQPGGGGYTGNENLALWTPSDPGYDPSNLYRNSNAHYFLPSENEWYKAAYYSGSGSTYYDYATQQDAPTRPTEVASGTGSGSAVYRQATPTGPADITQAGGLSHYGTMAQGGNVSEWVENADSAPNDVPSENRVLRGGNWTSAVGSLRSSVRDGTSGPTGSSSSDGFRVASVPEPAASVSLMLAGSLLLARRKRPAAR